MKKKDLLFVGFSLLIIISIFSFVFVQFRIADCQRVKKGFIDTNLTSFYGPNTSIEKRVEDTKRINKVYYGCLYKIF